MELDHYFDEVEALLLKNKKIILLEDCVNKQDEISEICLELKVDLEFFSNANKALESGMKILSVEVRICFNFSTRFTNC